MIEDYLSHTVEETGGEVVVDAEVSLVLDNKEVRKC